MSTSNVGVYLLSPGDAEAVQRLASDPAIAATTRMPHPYPENAAREFISQQLKERAEGTTYVFAIKDRQELVGLCGLHGIESNHAREIGFWIGRPFWGRGHASFGVKMVLDFAFRNLRLERVGSCALESNAASRHVLEKNGFRLLRVVSHSDPLLKRPHELVAEYEITRAQWLEKVNAPALEKLHPSLKKILQAELSAGNEVVETGGGWPDRDSVFVRLRDAFRTDRSQLPEGVQYLELNDPHWWKAEFSTALPKHILAYGG
jgi:ribosomal-protein-alanine N-acetyltransferase